MKIREHFRYSDEELNWIRENIEGTPYKELATLFNERFSLDKTDEQLRSLCGRHGLKNNIDSQFKKGTTPHNKGKKFPQGNNSGSFRKGVTPINYKEVGTERVTSDGYIEIKVKDPNVWKQKSHII